MSQPTTESPCDYINFIHYLFTANRMFFRPLPLGNEEAAVLADYLRDPEEQEYHKESLIIRRLPEKERKLATCAHFCFRVCFWNNEAVTPVQTQHFLKKQCEQDHLASVLVYELNQLKIKKDTGSESERKEAEESLQYFEQPQRCYRLIIAVNEDYHKKI
ncbi:hypothetical protein K491DRAFT_714905 [Lophiostoma macrostomum CBS 122681]|uniref:Uncharacterized protein n=1 Tax=Lophiostoma macrostomum CBS 122681 TaxID=1314788 RepID=A0A6A6TB14_9PLEO|nr:hypothetical protein K491DRAFT_714905 [Lophiostoma macrostomum CBS 122681]